MKFFQFKFRAGLAVGAALCALTLMGCGGGSSGGSVPPPPVPPPTGVSVTVQLRDSMGAPVEGLVTLGDQRRATTAGNASFASVSSGALTASAEVNGVNYSKNFVATSGANTVQISIVPSSVTPPGGNPPAPPTF